MIERIHTTGPAAGDTPTMGAGAKPAGFPLPRRSGMACCATWLTDGFRETTVDVMPLRALDEAVQAAMAHAVAPHPDSAGRYAAAIDALAVLCASSPLGIAAKLAALLDADAIPRTDDAAHQLLDSAFFTALALAEAGGDRMRSGRADADLTKAWADYVAAATALDRSAEPDASPATHALYARLDDATDRLIEGAPSSPAGVAAMLRFALDHLGEPIEADAARHDTPPADDDWSSDGFRVLYAAARALEAMPGQPALDADPLCTAMASVLAGLPPETMVARYLDGSAPWTAGAMLAEVRAGTARGRGWAADLLRTAAGMLTRAWEGPVSGDGDHIRMVARAVLAYHRAFEVMRAVAGEDAETRAELARMLRRDAEEMGGCRDTLEGQRADDFDAALALLEAEATVIMPEEPTLEMIQAGAAAGDIDADRARAVFAAMVDTHRRRAA